MAHQKLLSPNTKILKSSSRKSPKSLPPCLPRQGEGLLVAQNCLGPGAQALWVWHWPLLCDPASGRELLIGIPARTPGDSSTRFSLTNCLPNKNSGWVFSNHQTKRVVAKIHAWGLTCARVSELLLLNLVGFSRRSQGIVGFFFSIPIRLLSRGIFGKAWQFSPFLLSIEGSPLSLT